MTISSSFLHFLISPFPISSFPVPLFITTPGTDDKSERGEKTTSSSVLSASESKADRESSDSTPGVSSSKLTSDPKETELVQSVAKFIQAQTDMMAAQTRVMAAQSLPPLPHFSGEGEPSGRGQL